MLGKSILSDLGVGFYTWEKKLLILGLNVDCLVNFHLLHPLQRLVTSVFNWRFKIFLFIVGAR